MGLYIKAVYAQTWSVCVLILYSRNDVDSIREAVLTVSPNRQYLGIVRPTTPATTGPNKHNNTHIAFQNIVFSSSKYLKGSLQFNPIVRLNIIWLTACV